MLLTIAWLTLKIVELNTKYNKEKQEKEMYKKQCIRLCKDRAEVKRILKNDTTNLAKYY